MAFCIINRGGIAGAFNKMHSQYNGDLNNLMYNYYGYASSAATNAPPNLKGGLVLCSFNNSKDRGAQVYVSSEYRKFYYRRYDINGWKDGWQQLNLDYVPVNKAGDSVTGNLVFSDKNIGIQRVGRSSNYITGRDKALVRTTSVVAKNYSPIMSIKTTNGSWEVGSYDNSGTLDDLLFTYCTDTNYSSGTNSVKQIRFQEDGTIAGNLNGVAYRAINDNSGNNIVDTYVKKSGDTMTGNLLINSKFVQPISTNLQNDVVPKESTAGNAGYHIYIKNKTGSGNYQMGRITPAIYANGDQGVQFRTWRSVSGSTKYNELLLLVDTSGNPVVKVTNKKSWRDAIGINDESISYNKMTFYTGFGAWDTSGIHMPAAYKYGRVVHLFGSVRVASEISSDNSTTWTKVLQLPEGYRPARRDQYITYSSVDNARCVIRILDNGDMYVEWDWNGSASKIPVGRFFYINCTFISS